jgi:hypothetical protein
MYSGFFLTILSRIIRVFCEKLQNTVILCLDRPLDFALSYFVFSLSNTDYQVIWLLNNGIKHTSSTSAC